jgi:hypothetical protein
VAGRNAALAQHELRPVRARAQSGKHLFYLSKNDFPFKRPERKYLGNGPVEERKNSK